MPTKYGKGKVKAMPYKSKGGSNPAVGSADKGGMYEGPHSKKSYASDNPVVGGGKARKVAKGTQHKGSHSDVSYADANPTKGKKGSGKRNPYT